MSPGHVFAMGSVLAVACASQAEPVVSHPAAPAAAVRETTARVEPGPPPAAASRTADAGTDACHWKEEIAGAYRFGPKILDEAEFARRAEARLLPGADAERALTGIAQEVVSAMAHRDYAKLTAFTGPEGVCLRAAKGAPCHQLSNSELTSCARSKKKVPWNVDDGRDEAALYTCSEAFQKIFYARDFLRVERARYNCFHGLGRGNNGAPIMSQPTIGYVELHDPGSPDRNDWRSLWLVFDGGPDAPLLVELISEYWGI